MKHCPRCEQDKDTTYFSKHTKNGYQSICKMCARLDKLTRRYGVSSADYQRMLHAQNNQCRVCGITAADYAATHRTHGHLVVDHEHSTGRVRGLLCNPCNTAIGLFRDSPEIVDKAARYLREG